MAITSAISLLIDEIERDLQELRKEYILFLNDITQIEPYEQRDRLAGKAKRLRNMSHTRTEDQFRANNTVAKVQSNLNLWERQVNKKYAGAPRQKPKAPPPAPPPEPKSRSVVIGDPVREQDRVVSLYDDYMRLNLSLGSKKVINFSKFQSFISNQNKQVRQKRGGDRVLYEVAVVNGKVVVKTKSVRD